MARRAGSPARGIARGAVLLGALALAGCTTLGPPRPAVSYQADVRIEVVEADGAPRAVEQVTEFYAYGFRRRQATVEGRPLVVIDRPDLYVTWVLDPEAKTFEQLRIRSAEARIDALPDPFGPRARGVFVLDGEDEIAGRPALRVAVAGKGVEGRAWLSPDDVPLRFEGRIGLGEEARHVRIDYGEVQRSPPAAYLFAIPPDYEGYADRKKRTRDQEQREIEDAIDRIEDQMKNRPMTPLGL